ncbi:MAG: peptidase S41, partial [Alphaproteobacteria bacterium]|nr:peptidase S41 [Alphaproteobacteria bacterium]
MPDIEVEQAVLSPVEEGRRRVREADLPGTLDKAETSEDEDETKPSEPSDYQLTRALDLLRALS